MARPRNEPSSPRHFATHFTTSALSSYQPRFTNHGVGQDLIDSVFSLSRTFFRLPLDQKLLIDKRNSRHFRGWEPEGAESTNNRPDLREQIDLWSEHPARAPGVLPAYLRLLGPNQWLPEDVLPGFRLALGQWFADVGGLADELMALLARGLALPDDHFEKLFGTERMSFTKLIRYPATPPGNFGVNAHHDAGFLTVLAPGETPGLEVENAAGARRNAGPGGRKRRGRLDFGADHSPLVGRQHR